MGHQEMGLQLKKPGVDEQGQDGYWKVGLEQGREAAPLSCSLDSTVLREAYREGRTLLVMLCETM